MRSQASTTDGAKAKFLPIDGPIRVALAGLGAISRFHLSALQSIPDVTIIGGCDPDVRRSDFASKRWGIAVYRSVQDLLNAEVPVDVVHILVPPSRHVEVGLECLDRGCHLFLEKPMGVSSGECRALAEAATSSQRIVGINHNQRWNPAFVSLLKCAAEGYLGAIKNVAITYCLDTRLVRGHWASVGKFNSVLELGPHPLSLVIELLGPVQEVSAQACHMQSPSSTAVVSSWTANLVCATGSASCYVSFGDTCQECSLTVVGEDGSARVDLQRSLFQIWHKSQFSPELDSAFSTLRACGSLTSQALKNFIIYSSKVMGILRTSGDVFSQGMHASVANFYSALRNGQSAPVGVRDGEHVVQACEKVIAALGSSGF